MGLGAPVEADRRGCAAVKTYRPRHTAVVVLPDTAVADRRCQTAGAALP